MSESVGRRRRPGAAAGDARPAERGRAHGVLPARGRRRHVRSLTAILAFLVGGLVVLATGHNPLTTYREIFNGTGLNWFFQVGSHELACRSRRAVWFPWNVNDAESEAAFNLQQTLLITTPLVLTGLAVAFAFRCGLFNIGGQGQYIVGAIVSRLGRLVLGRDGRGPPHRARDRAGRRSPGRPGPASRASSRRPSAPTR